MAVHTNVLNIEDFFIRLVSNRVIPIHKGVISYNILEDTFRYGARTIISAEPAINAPRTKPIEFWWELDRNNGFIVNKPHISITPSNQSSDKVTVEITNWGNSDERLFAITPL